MRHNAPKERQCKKREKKRKDEEAMQRITFEDRAPRGPFTPLEALMDIYLYPPNNKLRKESPITLRHLLCKASRKSLFMHHNSYMLGFFSELTQRISELFHEILYLPTLPSCQTQLDQRKHHGDPTGNVRKAGSSTSGCGARDSQRHGTFFHNKKTQAAQKRRAALEGNI